MFPLSDMDSTDRDESLISHRDLRRSTDRWSALVSRIRAHEEAATAELYCHFRRGLRLTLYRHIGPERAEDELHDVFVIVIRAIQDGELRDPERLFGFARTVAQRQVAARIHEIVRERHSQADLEAGATVQDGQLDPEEAATERERSKLAAKVLSTMSSRDRDILTRFYLQEQSEEEICKEMELSATQFRLLKSRAKARFGELGRKMVGIPTAKALPSKESVARRCWGG